MQTCYLLLRKYALLLFSLFLFFPVILTYNLTEMAKRTRKPTNGRVLGAKFTPAESGEETDLKKVKADLLKELEEKQKVDNEWFDKELDKHLKGR